MVIKSVHVRNFRSILDESLDCDCLTALVGRNGAGKSAFLRALELFYDPSTKTPPEDFYAEDTSQDIEVVVTFTDLGTEEKDLFAPYIDSGELAIARVFSLTSGRKSGTYHGMRLQNSDFAEVRDAGSRSNIRSKYNELRTASQYSSLPTARSAGQALEALNQWEAGNPDACTKLRDDGQFFGFTEVGRGYLGRHTKFIRIPAVRDAAEDATEGKGSCVTEIMDLLVRSVLATRQDLASLKEEAQGRYKDIMDPAKLAELPRLEAQLTQTLKTFAPEAAVSLEWAPVADVQFPLPKASVRLLEDGYQASVQRSGHGLQRAFILTMLQHLSLARESANPAEQEQHPAEDSQQEGQVRLPDLVLAIEEPELYQHPCRQRHMASILLKLAEGTIPGVARRTQVIYSTHSPLFVGIDRFNQTRLLRKVECAPGSSDPKITRVSQVTADIVAEQLWELEGRPGEKFTGDTLMPRLQAIMTPWMNEGFFADVVVLVEGEGDRAALLGAAASKGHDLEAMGICIVPCMGKENLDRPWFIFRGLGIPTYAVWDSDHGDTEAKPDRNRRLCRLVDCCEEDWPTGVFHNHACFKCELESALKEELSPDLYDRLLGELRDKFGMKRKEQARKNAHVIRQIIDAAGKEGKTSHSLEAMVESIVALREKMRTT